VAHFRVWALVIAAAVLLAGCRVDTRVDVTLNRDGSGVLSTTVTLDGAAVQQVGGLTPLTMHDQLGDLQAAGWQVSQWTATPGGGASVTLTHPFTDQADLAARLADLVGPKGILRSPAITRTHGWLHSDESLSMVVDLTAPSTGIGSDADLQARLRAAGVDPTTLNQDLTAQLRAALHVSVVLQLPNGVTRTFDVPTGTTTTVQASHSSTNWDRAVEVGIAVLLLVLAGLFALAASASARRARRRSEQRSQGRRVEAERAPLM